MRGRFAARRTSASTVTWLAMLARRQGDHLVARPATGHARADGHDRAGTLEAERHVGLALDAQRLFELLEHAEGPQHVAEIEPRWRTRDFDLARLRRPPRAGLAAAGCRARPYFESRSWYGSSGISRPWGFCGGAADEPRSESPCRRGRRFRFPDRGPTPRRTEPWGAGGGGIQIDPRTLPLAAVPN